MSTLGMTGAPTSARVTWRSSVPSLGRRKARVSSRRTVAVKTIAKKVKLMASRVLVGTNAMVLEHQLRGWPNDRIRRRLLKLRVPSLRGVASSLPGGRRLHPCLCLRNAQSGMLDPSRAFSWGRDAAAALRRQAEHRRRGVEANGTGKTTSDAGNKTPLRRSAMETQEAEDKHHSGKEG